MDVVAFCNLHGIFWLPINITIDNGKKKHSLPVPFNNTGGWAKYTHFKGINAT